MSNESSIAGVASPLTKADFMNGKAFTDGKGWIWLRAVPFQNRVDIFTMEKAFANSPFWEDAAGIVRNITSEDFTLIEYTGAIKLSATVRFSDYILVEAVPKSSY